MNCKKMFAALALSATLVAPALVAQSSAPQAKQAKAVKFSVRNETKAALKLRAGDNHMTVAPGETAKVKVPAGQQIVSDETNATFNEGAVVTTVGESMDGTTLAIR